MGLNILYQETQIRSSFIVLILVLCICATLSTLCGLAGCFDAKHRVKQIVISFLILTASIIGIRWCAGQTETIVKATVDPQVSWKEINDSYLLVGQRGDLYTFIVKEKEAEQ